MRWSVSAKSPHRLTSLSHAVTVVTMNMDHESSRWTKAESGTNGQSAVAVVDRALDILEAFSSSKAEYGLTELAQTIGLPKATTHRLLMTLSRRGYISADSGRYRLGTRLLQLSHTLVSSLDIRRVARHRLVALRDLTMETVHLAIRDRDAVVYLEKVDSHHNVRPHTWVGYRAHLHSTALGKAMLAHESEGVIAQLIGGRVLDRLTARTVTDAREYLSVLRRVRLDGYALDDEEDTPGMRCVAAPVRDHSGCVCAAVGIAAPVDRMPIQRMHAMSADVVRTAHAISAQLGSRDNPDWGEVHHHG